MELDELLINAINDRESYPSESTAKKAMWLDEVISKAQDEIYKRCHAEGRKCKEIPYPGTGILKLFEYSVSYDHGNSWEDMFLTNDEIEEIKDISDEVIVR